MGRKSSFAVLNLLYNGQVKMCTEHVTLVFKLSLRSYYSLELFTISPEIGSELLYSNSNPDADVTFGKLGS